MSKEDDWTSSADTTDTDLKLLIGIEHLPTPIKTHMRRSLNNRPFFDNIYHVTEILYCLRKAYYKRRATDLNFDDGGLWNIYRGSTFDEKWSPLFDINQHTLKSEKDGLTLTGTLDFIWVDETNLERILYDLKMPKSVFFRKSSGAGKFYKAQVQTYLAMAHEGGELKDVHRCRVLMLADDLVIEEIPARDDILDIVWERTFLLDEALRTNNPNILKGAEEEWECKEPYCPAPVDWRLACKNYPILGEYPTY